MLKKFNEIQFLLQLIENQYLLVGKNTDFQDYLSYIKKYNLKNISEIKPEEIKAFIQEIEKANLNKIGNDSITSYDLILHEALIENKTNSSDIINEQKNKAIQDFIKKVFNITEEDFSELKEYALIIDNRLKEVLQHAIKRNCSIMVDAEQSYIQHYIDYLTAYFFKIYNKEESILSTTLQSYLKMQICRLMKLFEFCRLNNVKVGVKLVRGAYLNEERKLAEEGHYPSPICDIVEDTNRNYDESLKYIFENIKEKEKVNFIFLFGSILFIFNDI